MAASQASPIELGLARLAPWILWPFVPTAALFGGFAALLVSLGIIWLISFANGPLSAARPLAVGVVIYAFIRSGVLCAPNSQRAVALMLATFPLAVCAMFVLPASVMPPSHAPAPSPMPIASLEVDTPFLVPDRLAWLYLACFVFFILLSTIAAVAKSWRGDYEPARPLPRRWSATLRWVILCPATLLLAFLTLKWFGDPNGDPQYTTFIVLLSTAVFVLSATLIAPSNRPAVGICCVSLVALVAIAFAAFAHGQWQQFIIFKWTLALVAIAGAGVGFVAALTVRAANGDQNVTGAQGFLARLRWGKAWTASVASVSAVVITILAAHAVCFKPIDRLVYAPPPGWHRFPNIPFVAPHTQLGRWYKQPGTIWVFSWIEDGRAPSDPLRSPQNFDQSKNGAYKHFKLDSKQMIRICGTHQAMTQTFHASWDGESDAITDVYTTWGHVGYWAQYVRPVLAEDDPAALQSLTTLCGGSSAQRPSFPALVRPYKTGRSR
jgi:hypothetical protein